MVARQTIKNPINWLHPSDTRLREVKVAIGFLEDLREAIDPPKKRGTPVTGKNDRELHYILGDLSAKDIAVKNDRLKAILIDRFGAESYESKLRSLRTRMPRFCERIYGALYQSYPYYVSSPGFLRTEFVTDMMIRHVFQDWPRAEFPKDIPAFRIAAHRHLRRLAVQRLPALL
jgi:hypothetical protein